MSAISETSLQGTHQNRFFIVERNTNESSWGYIFLDALTNSGTAAAIKTSAYSGPFDEDLADRIFNFRYPGLNADFMSYCMLYLAGNDKYALLDPDTVSTLADRVFGVFFKHY